ncbi:MAG: hypothetical protein JNK00_07970 [Flavipsychrobacter sp.]|nr:hypothetical protein [Flavipsychrobacter sp.]
MNNRKIILDKVQIDQFVIFPFILYSFFSQYMWITIVAGISFYIILSSLWVKYLPPMLTYLFLYQWIQVFGGVLYSDYMGIPFDELFTSKDADGLFIATFIQMAVMVLFMANIFKPTVFSGLEIMKEAASKLDTKKVLTVYGVFSLVFPTLIALTYSNPSLNQLVQSFAVLRKVSLIMLIFLLLLQKTKFNNLIIILLVVEFGLGFVSYFSSFKEIIYFFVFTYFTVKPNFKSRQVMRVAPVGLALVFFMVFWSSIKGGYRQYLNQGSGQQQIAVSTYDALNYLGDKTTNYSVDSLKTGSEVLLNRIQYMHQYSTVYGRVPSIIAHTNGDNVWSTIKFLTAPRFLTENKSILDPSTKTSYYTGKNFANAERGTSISMGYFCDLYIDYGLLLMMIPLLVITFFIGKVSNYIINSDKYNLIFNFALFIATILSLGTFESDIIFYLGSIRNYLVFMILGNYFIFPWLNKYISAR